LTLARRRSHFSNFGPPAERRPLLCGTSSRGCTWHFHGTLAHLITGPTLVHAPKEGANRPLSSRILPPILTQRESGDSSPHTRPHAASPQHFRYTMASLASQVAPPRPQKPPAALQDRPRARSTRSDLGGLAGADFDPKNALRQLSPRAPTASSRHSRYTMASLASGSAAPATETARRASGSSASALDSLEPWRPRRCRFRPEECATDIER
jgi:hypothetical protein